MPSMTRMILIALHAAAITILTQTALQAVAAPLPLPTTVYMRPILSPRTVSRPFSRSMRIIRNVTSSSVPTSPHLAFARAISESETETIKPVSTSAQNTTADHYAQLMNLHQATRRNSRNLRKLAAQSASSKAKDPDFQRKCEAQLNDFHSNILVQQAAFSAIVHEKHEAISGRSNYHEGRPLEELMKGLITTNKKTLKYCYDIVANIPGLGPLLGPIVYDLKCLVDVILNYSEDIVDGILNLVGL